MEKIGIDIVSVKRIKLKTRFINLVLHLDEIKILNQKKSLKNKREFLAGRWAVKEAVLKTLEKPVPMNQINISYENEKPFITSFGFEKTLISLSHEKRFAVGMAIKKD